MALLTMIPEPEGVLSANPPSGRANYEGKSFLAQGAAADVWLVTGASDTHSAVYVSKIVRLNVETLHHHRNPKSNIDVNCLWEGFLKEITAKAERWSSLRHRNVVRVFELNERLDLRVEYCPGGTASQYLSSCQPESDCIAYRRNMIRDVVRGIAYLHSQEPPVVHGSISMNKLFVDGDGVAKVGEFGLASLAENFASLAPAIMPNNFYRWMSPELIDPDNEDEVPRPTTASDTWALGCTLFQIMSAKLPYFESQHELKVCAEVISGKPPGHLDHCLSPGLAVVWPLLEMCWLFRPESRVTSPALERLMSTQYTDLGTQPNPTTATLGSETALRHHKKRAVPVIHIGIICNIAAYLLDIGREKDVAALSLLSRAHCDSINDILWNHIALSTSSRCEKLTKTLLHCGSKQRRTQMASRIRTVSADLHGGHPVETGNLSYSSHHDTAQILEVDLVELCALCPKLQILTVTEQRSKDDVVRSLSNASSHPTNLGAFGAVTSLTLVNPSGNLCVSLLLLLPRLEELRLFGDIVPHCLEEHSPYSGNCLRRVTWGLSLPPTLRDIMWLFSGSNKVTGGDLALLVAPVTRDELERIQQYTQSRSIILTCTTKPQLKIGDQHQCQAHTLVAPLTHKTAKPLSSAAHVGDVHARSKAPSTSNKPPPTAPSPPSSRVSVSKNEIGSPKAADHVVVTPCAKSSPPTERTRRSYRDVAKPIPSPSVTRNPGSSILTPPRSAWPKLSTREYLQSQPSKRNLRHAPCERLPLNLVYSYSINRAQNREPPPAPLLVKYQREDHNVEYQELRHYCSQQGGDWCPRFCFKKAPSPPKTTTSKSDAHLAIPPRAESPIPNRGGTGLKKAERCNTPPLLPGILGPPKRPRRASISSVATSILSTASSPVPSIPTSKATSMAPSPLAHGLPVPKKASHPNWESEPWYGELVTFARNMKQKNRAAWEKILGSDPKDTSKMKWSEFDSALKALGFNVCARGGSDLEYTPTLFGSEAQPISYHRPHPGQEFSLGDLKAKSNSFRKQYPGAVAALHQAWGLTDTRL